MEPKDRYLPPLGIIGARAPMRCSTHVAPPVDFR
jgi:hypothetical protein